jgi:hypothetical protein
MLQINGDGVCHAGPPGSHMVPEQYISEVQRGLTIIRDRIRGRERCDAIFSALPRGRTFQQLFDDVTSFVNYDPSNRQGDWGWTIPGTYPKDVVISQFTIRMGRWSIAGTIVHELAHLNGADGHSHAAEETLKYCDLQSPNGPYNPNIRG